MTAYLFSFAIKSKKFAIAAPYVNRWLALMVLSLPLASIAITLSIFMESEDTSSVQEQAIHFLGLVYALNLIALSLTSYRRIAESPKPKGESYV
jgi:hypothetical protein